MRRFILEDGGDLPAPFRNYTVKLIAGPLDFCAMFFIYRRCVRIASCHLLTAREAFQTIWPIMKRDFRSPSGTLPKFVSEALNGPEDVPWLMVWQEIDDSRLPQVKTALLEELEAGLAYALLDESDAYRRKEC
jgi:hypothetical protein